MNVAVAFLPEFVLHSPGTPSTWGVSEAWEVLRLPWTTTGTHSNFQVGSTHCFANRSQGWRHQEPQNGFFKGSPAKLQTKKKMVLG